MPNVVTKCKKHGIVNTEQMPQSMDDGHVPVGQMRICPICNKATEIDYPGEALPIVERSYVSPWLEDDSVL